MIPKGFKGLKRIEVLITFHVNVFLGNKCNSYIYCSKYMVTSTKNVNEKTVMKRKKEAFQKRIWNPLENLR